jgi:hypothetical protein
MADYGILRRFQRERLPIQVLIGFNPTEPLKLSYLAPPIDGQGIRQGMVLKRGTGNVAGVSGTAGFLKTVTADSTSTASLFIALHDQDSHDVQAAGKLVGLDCSDDFEIRSGYFDPDETWALDDPLTAGDGGILVKAGEGDTVLGYISAIDAGDAKGRIRYTGKTPSCPAADAFMIQFKTARNGQAIPVEEDEG